MHSKTLNLFGSQNLFGEGVRKISSWTCHFSPLQQAADLRITPYVPASSATIKRSPLAFVGPQNARQALGSGEHVEFWGTESNRIAGRAISTGCWMTLS